MGRIGITETVLRDAHQSLLATRMRTRDMLPIAEQLDEVGFFSLEMWGGATFDSCIRFLNEDPWERLRSLKRAMPRTPLQMLLRGQNLVGYKHYADDVVERFIAKSREHGIDIFRIFDALNDIRNMEFAIRIVKREGAHAQGTISYTISPVHTIEKFVALGKELVELGCDSLCVKDMAGLISPTAASNLIRALRDETSIPISLHSHCTSGVAPISYYAACEAGVSVLDTAMSPFAWGTSQPPTESIVFSLRGTLYDTGIDVGKLEEIKRYFDKVREKYQPLIDPIAERADTGVLVHQIPGGMLSNLVSQLKEQNALDKYDEVLRELPRVRAEMGYPPLVTPTSQIVGTQAVFNVIIGERYKIVSQETKNYFRGLYGRPPAPVDEKIKQLVIGDEEPITCRPADLIPPQLALLEEEGRNLGIIHSEEDLLTFALYPAVAPKFLRGEAREEEIVAVPGPVPDPIEPPVAPPVASTMSFTVDVDGDIYHVRVSPTSEVEVTPSVEVQAPAKASDGAVVAPMQGVILKVKVKRHDHVEKGDIVALLEAMKMQNNVLAHKAGTVGDILVHEGQTVLAGQPILLIEEDS